MLSKEYEFYVRVCVYVCVCALACAHARTRESWMDAIVSKCIIIVENI